MRTLVLSSIAATLLACAREPGPSSDPHRSNESASGLITSAETSAADGYAASNHAPGRWRLASLDELSRVLIPLSHILVRHEDVPEGIVSFHLPDWKPAPAPPQRTVDQARALAAQLSERLRKSPGEFAAVAREISEDIATQSLGGTLGTILAAELLRTPEVLDALAAIGPGEVSRAVETPYGFHIFRRNPPPDEETVSGARILIAHDQAPWLGAFLARRPLPARSRDEAMRLAQSIYERAKSGEPFDQLAREYSDHREALRGGDFGAWSTREPTPFRREIELLAGLEVGELYPPIDSQFGVAILRRVPNRARQSFAMTAIQQRFNSRASEADPSSRGWVLKNLRALSEEIERDPSKFESFQKEYCCETDEQWIEGRGEAEAEAVLARLRPGEIGTAPVALAAAFGIIKRVEPRPVSAPQFTFELPAPDKPDIPYLVSNGRLPIVLQGFAAESALALGLEPAITSEFTSLLDQGASSHIWPVSAPQFTFQSCQLPTSQTYPYLVSNGRLPIVLQGFAAESALALGLWSPQSRVSLRKAFTARMAWPGSWACHWKTVRRGSSESRVICRRCLAPRASRHTSSFWKRASRKSCCKLNQPRPAGPRALCQCR